MSAPSGGPLAGLRVVELATFLTGPLATQALADMGATVDKVEPPGGDPMRRFGRSVDGLSLQWAASNRGKRSVTIDLAGDDGRQQLEGLLEGADVMVSNWRPGVAERLGLEPSRLAAAHPGLVWCRISGFGQDGPRALEPAFDSVVQAASGMMATQGDERPEMVRAYLADKITAVYATQAILAALHRRSATGTGGVVDVAMLDALSYFDFPDVMVERALVDDRHGDGTNKQLAAVTAVPTADGWLVAAPVRGRQIQAALEVAGHPEWGGQLRGLEPTAMTARFYQLLASVTPQRPTAHWVDALRAADVPSAEVLGPDGHLQDPQVRHNGIYEEMDHPTLGRVRYARHPARWDGRGG